MSRTQLSDSGTRLPVPSIDTSNTVSRSSPSLVQPAKTEKIDRANRVQTRFSLHRRSSSSVRRGLLRIPTVLRFSERNASLKLVRRNKRGRGFTPLNGETTQHDWSVKEEGRGFQGKKSALTRSRSSSVRVDRSERAASKREDRSTCARIAASSGSRKQVSAGIRSCTDRSTENGERGTERIRPSFLRSRCSNNLIVGRVSLSSFLPPAAGKHRAKLVESFETGGKRSEVSEKADVCRR